jgi:hypothetical protein
MKTNGTLSEQINALIEQEKEIMNNDMGLAMQLFGAEVDDNGKAVEGGKRGFRVITHTTETDSQGTDENESILSNKDLFKSAWQEVAEFNRQVRIGEAQRSAFHFELLEREEAIVKEWEEGNITDDEANGQLDSLKGCLVDLTDKDMNAYFVERELDESSPELLGFKFDAPDFNRLLDEVDKEYVQFKKVKLEDRNWPHLQSMDDKRIQRFEWLKVKVRTSFDECKRLKMLGYSIIYREELVKFTALKNKISEARDYSFAHKLLDSLVPAMKGKAWWMKRNFYLKLDLQRKIRSSGKKFNLNQHLNKVDARAYSVYNESRGLTFEQHKVLMDGWTKMSAILASPKGK